MSIEALKNQEPVFEIKESLFPIDDRIAKFGYAGAGLIFLSIAALATAGLLLPHTSFGMALTHVTQAGLIATSASAGIVAVVLFSIAVFLHIREAKFLASEVRHISEENNKGFLYKIKNGEGETIGYLLGSCHEMARDWPGLNDRIMKKFNRSETAFFETHIPPLMGFSCWLMGMKVGADGILQKLARKMGKQIWAFERIQTQLLRGQEIAQFERAHPREKTNEETPRLSDTQIWRIGDPQNVMDDWSDIVKGFTEEEEKEYNELLLGRANQIYTNYIMQGLQRLNCSREKKIFIVVGEAHLYDFPGSQGLISRLEESGWTIENAYPDPIEPESSASED